MAAHLANFLSCEAVLGCESYFFEPRYTEKAAELDTVLPFTRNAVGPMDLTPVACSPKKFRAHHHGGPSTGRGAHFHLGIVHYADQPEFFESLPRRSCKSSAMPPRAGMKLAAWRRPGALGRLRPPRGQAGSSPASAASANIPPVNPDWLPTESSRHGLQSPRAATPKCRSPSKPPDPKIETPFPRGAASSCGWIK